MAKGLTSGHLPLGAMGVSDRIAAHFRDNVFWTGLTYSAHPMGLAAAVAALDVLVEEKLVAHAAAMEPVMRRHLAELQARHPSIGATRATGLFGVIEFRRNSRGEPLSGYNQTHEGVSKLMKALFAEGLFTMAHWNTVMCNPPLCITEDQIGEAFAIFDRALKATDAFYEG
jgi:taurine--2-oxoglutarate transaminase